MEIINPVNDLSASGPDFSAPVPNNGYRWWYVDAFSDDDLHGLTIIAFVGSVFSPYYVSARRSGRGDPENHCAINVALYGKGGKRWALTERGRGDLSREKSRLNIGRSAMQWDGAALTITVNEVTAPLPSRIQGIVRLTPTATTRETFTLCEDGHHRWQPIAPSARVELNLTRPNLSWSGHGYFDTNWGATPLESAFQNWTWSRATSSNGTTIFYQGNRRKDGAFSLSLDIDRDGHARRIAAPPTAHLPPTPVWRFPRSTPADVGATPKVIQTFEDTPFYARSMCATTIDGHSLVAMHESLSLDRFASRWVQTLLPFRMPRIAKR